MFMMNVMTLVFFVLFIYCIVQFFNDRELQKN